MMTDTDFIQIAQNKADIQSRIDKAVARRANAHKVTLVAVSKVQPDSRIEAGLASGQRVFAENRVQEGQKHWDGRRAAYSDLQLRLIGPLQTNKAEDAIRLFDVIETLDRPKLARALAKAIQARNRKKLACLQRIFLNYARLPKNWGYLFVALCAFHRPLNLLARTLPYLQNWPLNTTLMCSLWV
jgi:uncharacterized pyridoxal phosphate-containing UPF0001 family protein